MARNCTTTCLPSPPPVNPNSQIAHVVSPIQSTHASKKLKNDIPKHVQDKGKEVASPSSSSKESSKFVSSRLYLKDDWSHVINAIQPQGSNKPKAAIEKSREDSSEKRQTVSHNKYGFLWLLCCFEDNFSLFWPSFGQQAFI